MGTEDAPSSARWAGFLAMCLGMFMAILDIQVVITSLSRIDEALDIGADRMSWVQTSYLIAEIIAIPLTGFLARVFTLRKLFAGAIVLFMAASLGCAASQGFGMLIAFRAAQGFAGGLLIPLVFSGVYLLFPGRGQLLATGLAGMFAVLAPTLGPFVGGWLTENYSWHWMFLINIVPGAVAFAAAVLFLPKGERESGLWRSLDVAGLALLAIALGSFQIAMKEAPSRGWDSLPVVLLLGCVLIAGAAFILATLKNQTPVVHLDLFRDRTFAAGCALSFTLGLALYGSVYLLPLFLALVREMGPLAIGGFMLVAGVSQLIATPVAVILERRLDGRLLAGAGFMAFGFGLYLNAHSTAETGFDELFWPQAIRGAAVMLCILPPTQMALGALAPARIGDGSSLFNLLRNIGGAIGIALVDTMIFSRAPTHAEAILEKLKANDPEATAAFGVSPADLEEGTDPMALMGVMSDIQEASLVLAANEAWTLLAVIAVAGLAALPFVRSRPV
jgi:MFS transporter, DHA2 family, multidrug resistance protein